MPVTTLLDRPTLHRYDAEVVERKHVDWDGFRVESETRCITGLRDFDLCVPRHVLTLALEGRPRRVEGRFDGGPLQRSPVLPGQLFFLPAGQRFRGHTEGTGSRTTLVLGFEDGLVAGATAQEPDPSHVEFIPSVDLRNPAVSQTMTVLARELREPGVIGRLYGEALALVTLGEVLRQQSVLRMPGRAVDARPRRLRRVVEYIEANLRDDVSVFSLAAEAGLSPVHFARQFRRHTGLSPHQYVLRRRVERARALLVLRDRSLAEVALAVGFSSQAHLTTAFGRVYGTTPGAFRSAHAPGH